jgi:hypothetical protein
MKKVKHFRYHGHHDHLARRLFGSGPAPTPQQVWDSMSTKQHIIVLIGGGIILGTLLALVQCGFQFN